MFKSSVIGAAQQTAQAAKPPSRVPKNLLARLPEDLLTDIVEAAATCDLQNLHRAWPAIEHRTTPVHGPQLEVTLPRSFCEVEPARRWQMQHHLQRAQQAQRAGNAWERNLTGFCDSTMVMVAADGGFVQTFFDAQDRFTSYTTRLAPEIMHDGSYDLQPKTGEAGVDGMAFCDFLQTTGDDRYIARLGELSRGTMMPGDVPWGDFTVGTAPPCPVADMTAYRQLIANNVLPLTLVDAAHQPPSSAPISLMEPRSTFCFDRNASHLLVMHRDAVAHRAYRGGGLLLLRPRDGQPAWFSLPPALQGVSLAPGAAVGTLGRNAFIIAGEHAFIALDPLSQQTCAVPRKDGESLTNAPGWSADGRHIAFATDRRICLLSRTSAEAWRLAIEITLPGESFGTIDQMHLTPKPNHVSCTAGFSRNTEEVWAEWEPTNNRAAPWHIIARGSPVALSSAGYPLGIIESSTRLRPHASFLLREEADLVAYKRNRRGWHRRTLGKVEQSGYSHTQVDLSPSGSLLLTTGPEGEPTILPYSATNTTPSNVNLPPWLQLTGQLFFSALTGDVMGIFDKISESTVIPSEHIKHLEPDPVLEGKVGNAETQERESWDKDVSNRAVLATFSPAASGWHFRHGTYVADYPSYCISRDGSALILSEYYNHQLVDFSGR